MKLFQFLLLICMMLPLGAMAQRVFNPPPPNAVIDNSAVDGERKNKSLSELNPKNATPKPEYIVQSFGPITFCYDFDARQKVCNSYERIFKMKSSNFDILGDFKISMGINDILKQCSYRRPTSRGHTEALFKCENDKLSKESTIELIVFVYDHVNALQFSGVLYETCSPPWAEIKPKIIEKYSPKSSKFTVDLSENKSPEDSLRFYADDEFEQLIVFHNKSNKNCPGGMSLKFYLSNNINFWNESVDLKKAISEAAAKKTTAPKF